MKFLKTFNNSAALAMNDQSQEEIVLGKGVGLASRRAIRLMKVKLNVALLLKMKWTKLRGLTPRRWKSLIK